MKKNTIITTTLLLTISVIIGTSIFFTSCKKYSDEYTTTKEQTLKKSENDSVTNDETLTPKRVTITVSWEDWGRKKKNCAGAGLCYFRIEITIIKSPSAHSAELYYDRDGKTYINVLIDKKFVFDSESTDFYIDENLYSQDENGQLYMIPQGRYKLNSALGTQGGYTIPVIIVKN